MLVAADLIPAFHCNRASHHITTNTSCHVSHASLMNANNTVLCVVVSSYHTHLQAGIKSRSKVQTEGSKVRSIQAPHILECTQNTMEMS